jgi:Ca2+/H+ antiporter, TMEM165/GDT1 family
MFDSFVGQIAPSLLTCTVVVALAEMGDKTQLLSLMLATRFKQFWPIVLGITVATLLNHGLAAALGATLQQWLPKWALPWVLAVSFIAIGLWLLKPDELGNTTVGDQSRFGVFGITVVAFFLAEMGDKTQIATVALAARYQSIGVVTVGTTLGMLLANAPAVFLGQRFAERLPIALLNKLAAILFIAIGLWIAFFGQQSV